MNKVAFLLLTNKDFERKDIWSKFFSQKDDRYNLYVHSTENSEMDWINKKRVQKRIKTSWASFSLVKAQNLMLAEALLDTENTTFILLSESHCPLYGLTEMIDRLLSLHGNYFSKEDYEDIARRWDRSKFSRASSVVHRSYFGFASQWWILDRETATFFATEANKYEPLFKNTWFSDEHYYITLCNFKGIKYNLEGKTYNNWNLNTSSPFISIVKRSKPKTYFNVHNNFIDVLRNRKYLFFRKIHKLSKINVKKLLS